MSSHSSIRVGTTTGVSKVAIGGGAQRHPTTIETNSGVIAASTKFGQLKFPFVLSFRNNMYRRV